MKKIIAAFDGFKYSKSTRDYAVLLSKQNNTHLVGVFLDDPSYTSYKIYELVTQDGTSVERLKAFEKKDKETRLRASQSFEKTCQQQKLEFTVHHDHRIAIHDLKHESIYADLLIIDSTETLTHYSEKIPSRFIRDLLGDVQCPVLLVPKKFSPISKIVLLYDGEPSSVFAIKMFSYLLSGLKNLSIKIVCVRPLHKSLHMPDNKLMKEFMKRHFSNATFTILKGYAEDEILKYLKPLDPDTLVVLGAYRRSSVSRWFRESMADVLMKEVKLPLFIAHNK